MQFLVSYASSKDKEIALNLAKHFHLPFVTKESMNDRQFNDAYFFIYQPNNSFIRKGLGRLTKEIFCNFHEWSMNFTDPLLSKCLKGLPSDFKALDATAGLGKDALEIAKNKNCQSVVLLEKERWLFYLLQEGINRTEDHKSLINVNKLTVKNDDSIKFLRTGRGHFDLIYVDPMFQGTSKSKAKSAMQALRDLTKKVDSDCFLELAIKNASKRVIVKRHNKSKYLENKKPDYSITGKVVRYDVYNSN
tara:strand:+ start:5071 stop:5814 length:744 start_codon:yes stop_codon:yes gene_type:complete